MEELIKLRKENKKIELQQSISSNKHHRENLKINMRRKKKKIEMIKRKIREKIEIEKVEKIETVPDRMEIIIVIAIIMGEVGPDLRKKNQNSKVVVED